MYRFKKSKKNHKTLFYQKDQGIPNMSSKHMIQSNQHGHRNSLSITPQKQLINPSKSGTTKRKSTIPDKLKRQKKAKMNVITRPNTNNHEMEAKRKRSPKKKKERTSLTLSAVIDRKRTPHIDNVY